LEEDGQDPESWLCDRDVLLLATVAAVLRESAKLPQAAIVMPPVTISKTAVMTSQQLAATVSAML